MAEYHVQFLVNLTFALAYDQVKSILFQNMAMLHIKVKGMQYTTTYRNKLPLHTPLTPEWAQKVKTIFFLKMIILKLKRMTYITTCKQ